MRRWLLMLLPFFILLPSVKAAALSQNDLKSINGDTVWYAPSGELNSCSVSVDVNLSGNDNIQKAFNFFVGQGLSVNQAAGIVGNMMWESGLIPEKIQGGSTSQNPADAGANGWGIVQWTPANTKVPGIVSTTNIRGLVYELSTQLQMVWAQLTGAAGSYSETQVGQDIRSTMSVEDAVRAFQGDSKIGGKYTGFERPKDEQATLQNRIGLANEVLQNYGSSSGTSVAVPSQNSGGCSSSGPGVNTQFVDGFTIYSQYDPAWANKPYGDTTIAAAGCGPSAMAMIITALTGHQVTPDITAAYADSQGLYVKKEGSSWSIGRVLADHWGLRATAIGADVAKISASLQSGSLIIASGQGPSPFTTGGHFIVIRGVTADGKWKVGDSGHNNTSTQDWDPQQLVNSMNDGSVYAISK